MPQPFPSARHQAALELPTGYRRWMRFTFIRAGESIELEPISGRLTQDTRRNGQWDGQLQFSGNHLLPQSPADILTPFGTRVEVELGLELLDGGVSTVPYGVYEVASARTTVRADQRLVDVGLADMSGVVERYRFETPLTIASGTTLPDMINSVLIDRTGQNPGVPVDATAIGAPRTFGLDPETGPWSEIQDVLASFSRKAFYNRVGHINLMSTNVDPESAYALPSIASLSADFDTRPPNVIVVRGEPQDGSAPVQAVAMDTDPSSPTYAGPAPGTSPYGRVTRFYASPLIETVPQAQSAANTLLAASIGAGATYEVTLPYDPTVSGGDVVSIGGATLAVDAVTVNLTGDTVLQVREL